MQDVKLHKQNVDVHELKRQLAKAREQLAVTERAAAVMRDFIKSQKKWRAQ